MNKKQFFLIIPFALSSLFSCGQGKTSVSILYEGEDDLISFGVETIKTSLEDQGFKIADSKGDYTINIASPSNDFSSQEYSVKSKDKTFTINGGDSNGIFYGLIDLKDKISFDGIANIQDFSGSPDIEKRGIKFDLPLDMRTPSYGDQADSAQENILNIWDISFWKEELDAMALDKYNALTVWSLNPFPSMVKVPDYPDVALDDVWKTNIKFDDTYNGTASNFVRDEHWQEGNYQVIKKMSIDEKIEHWKTVMDYAHSRGIEFYIMTWNIYTYGEHGKYGITSDVNNTTTIDYYRKSVKGMFDTYPDLDGIGCTAGENMDWSTGNETVNESWLYSTFGEGINDYLKENPGRNIRLLHRLHLTEFNLIEDIWKDFKGTLDYSDNYSKAHMFSSRKPVFTNETFELMPEDKRIFLELRTDDFYIHRYGNPNFVRDYYSNMPDSSKVRGVWIGGDGYCRGRDYSSKDESENGILHYKKDWFNNAVMGRLAYDKSLSNDYFKSLLGQHYSNIDKSKVNHLFEAMANAGEILPETTMQYFLNGDAAWFPEGGFGHSTMNGFISLKKLINSNNAMEGSNRIGFGTYCKAVESGDQSVLDGVITPDKVSERIQNFSQKAYEEANLAKEGVSGNDTGSKEFLATVQDQIEFSYLGEYYSNKFLSAINLRFFNDSKDESYRALSKEKMQLAVDGYSKYSESYSFRYKDLRLGRAGDFHINDVLDDVKADLSIIDKWVQKTY